MRVQIGDYYLLYYVHSYDTYTLEESNEVHLKLTITEIFKAPSLINETIWLVFEDEPNTVWIGILSDIKAQQGYSILYLRGITIESFDKPQWNPPPSWKKELIKALDFN